MNTSSKAFLVVGALLSTTYVACSTNDKKAETRGKPAETSDKPAEASAKMADTSMPSAAGLERKSIARPVDVTDLRGFRDAVNLHLLNAIDAGGIPAGAVAGGERCAVDRSIFRDVIDRKAICEKGKRFEDTPRPLTLEEAKGLHEVLEARLDAIVKDPNQAKDLRELRVDSTGLAERAK
jgi:hypothetical protein